jgi:hypothetical protein
MLSSLLLLSSSSSSSSLVVYLKTPLAQSIITMVMNWIGYAYGRTLSCPNSSTVVMIFASRDQGKPKTSG